MYKKNLFLKILLIHISVISVGHSAEIKKQFYFLGGGGEPLGKTTIFDDQVNRIGKFTNNSDWDTTVSFDGGHSETEAALKSKMSKARNAGPFVEKNYNILMDEIISKLKAGELKSGDQLMISILTHGAQRLPGYSTEKTHQVAMSHSTATELTNLTGANTIDLDKLETIIQLAADNNVKLAIMDLSCFSGNLLNIKNENVCLISASGPEQYSYSSAVLNLGFMKLPLKPTFGGKLIQSFKKGKNLEEIFLTARAASGDVPDFPMISTSEGLEVNDLIYNLMSPYLKYDDKQSKDFGNQYLLKSDKFEQRVCNIDLNHQQTLDILKLYENMNSITSEISGKEFENLRTSLEKYRIYQKQYESALRGKFEVEAEIRGILESKFPNDKNAWDFLNPLSLLTVNMEYSIKMFEEFSERDKGDKDIAKIWDTSLLQAKKQKEIATYVKNNLSDVSKLKVSALNKAYKNSDETKKLASKVSIEAKKIYSSLYKKFKKPGSNPCRDFVL